ncbi:uncharacterized protein LOC120639579 isoform X2 [Panicum virgatum]|nr:uncharacterized protein LOC120639579 isoform X2 [Panicum virgatum]
MASSEPPLPRIRAALPDASGAAASSPGHPPHRVRLAAPPPRPVARPRVTVALPLRHCWSARGRARALLPPHPSALRTKQSRLFPLLASAYAFRFVGDWVKWLYANATRKLEAKDYSTLQEAHACTSGLKVVTTSGANSSEEHKADAEPSGDNASLEKQMEADEVSAKTSENIVTPDKPMEEGEASVDRASTEPLEDNAALEEPKEEKRRFTSCLGTE